MSKIEELIEASLTRGEIQLDSVGAGVTMYGPSRGLSSKGSTRIGLNSPSYGSVDYEKSEKYDATADDNHEKERDTIQKDLMKISSDFDKKVVSVMSKYGYKMVR